MARVVEVTVASPNSILLSKGVTVAKYRKLEEAQDRESISDFVRNRFMERYISPLDVPLDQKSGFALMAISCLMIEALESFARGWADTNGRSELAFCSFFCRWEQFNELRPHSATFYRHFRCAILHQAETTGGWRIWRRGALIDPKSRTLNATLFLKRLGLVLEEYSAKLRKEHWNSDTWMCFRKKMATVCRNAEGSKVTDPNHA